MLSARKSRTLVGLDVEAGSVAATELVTNGSQRLGSTGIAPLAPGVTRDGEIADPDALAELLRDLFAERDLAKSVRVGIANQRLVVRVLRLPLIENRDEMETAIRFQAQDHIPMSLEQAVLEWQVVAMGVGEDQRQMDVVVIAARREMVSALTHALRAAGLRPVGIDLSAFGMIRALAGEADLERTAQMPAPEQSEGGEVEAGAEPGFQPAKLYCNLGDVTNLAVARGRNCLFTRVSSYGVEGMAERLSERRALTLEHSREWLTHVGLEQPLEEIEGDPETVAVTREVLAEGASKLADELRLSLEFYGAQDGAVAVEQILACGPGTTIPGLGERLQHELGYAVQVARPRALDHLDDAEAARLTLSYGLALEE